MWLSAAVPLVHAKVMRANGVSVLSFNRGFQSVLSASQSVSLNVTGRGLSSLLLSAAHFSPSEYQHHQQPKGATHKKQSKHEGRFF